MKQPATADHTHVVAHDIGSRMGVLSEAECVRLLQSVPVGRMGFIAEGIPMVVPINYVWHDGLLAFRTTQGHKLAAATVRQEVCLEIDDWDAETRTGWSVIARGTAEAIAEADSIRQLDETGMTSWSSVSKQQVWVAIHPFEITGRSLLRPLCTS